MSVRQGEIWWLDQPDHRRRPVLVLSRNEVLPVLFDALVAPVTTRIRGLPTEVFLDGGDGVPKPSAANLQHIMDVPQSMLTDRVGMLAPARWYEVCAAMRAAIDC